MNRELPFSIEVRKAVIRDLCSSASRLTIGEIKEYLLSNYDVKDIGVGFKTTLGSIYLEYRLFFESEEDMNEFRMRYIL